MEIIFRPDPSIWDGRFANNGWLQELPKPVSKLTWDNAAQLSPATAAQLGLATGDIVDINTGGRKVSAPVLVVPGQADGTVIATLGYGRVTNFRVATPEFDARAPFGIGENRTRTPLGFNAYALRTSQAPHFLGGTQLAKTGTAYKMAITQGHFRLEGRKEDIAPSGTLEQFTQNEEFLHGEGHHEVLSLFPPYEYTGYAWGMSIDLSVCTGCNACTVACQAENNISIVGKEQVWRGREMHWIRIDQYFEGSENDPRIANQPMLCQHCELAPCEIVCPVAATSHDTEGLNVMTYNRCVGTKYCSNNCPYKVRRFSYLQYGYMDRSDDDYQNRPKSLRLMYNPDVTVRSRGVMEKCTFCLQRISEARIEAEKANRQIADGEVITACQQVCPTQAIVFGNINDPNAAVSKLKAEPTTYGALPELNTKPRVTYMARLRNLNPALGSAENETE
ncbi:MAG TPA: 4Fe-4S dicluster domain-containing protein [Roseiflexaceae bacterium]|nr:4Fe-4S dicluster domain-containing protein [Roseiflexaceae bacterium]